MAKPRTDEVKEQIRQYCRDNPAAKIRDVCEVFQPLAPKVACVLRREALGLKKHTRTPRRKYDRDDLTVQIVTAKKAGLTIEAIAELLSVPFGTIQLYWQNAKERMDSNEKEAIPNTQRIEIDLEGEDRGTITGFVKYFQHRPQHFTQIYKLPAEIGHMKQAWKSVMGERRAIR